RAGQSDGGLPRDHAGAALLPAGGAPGAGAAPARGAGADRGRGGRLRGCRRDREALVLRAVGISGATTTCMSHEAWMTSRTKPLVPAEQDRLLRELRRTGDPGIERRLIESNLRLVLKIARSLDRSHG